MREGQQSSSSRGEDVDSLETLLERLPALKNPRNLALTGIIFHLIILVLIVVFALVSQISLIGAILMQFLVLIVGTAPYRYLSRNAEKIRILYLKRYGDLAEQALWFRYQFPFLPLLTASLLFPIILKTDYFLPALINLPEHFITRTLLPAYLSLPLGIGMLIFGLLVRRSSKEFDIDIMFYFHVIHPERGKLITGEKYAYVRHPRYLGRGATTIGLGILANNLLAIIIAFIHFLMFLSLIPSEEKDLIRRFGKEYIDYKKRVPAIIPRIGTWKDFLRSLVR